MDDYYFIIIVLVVLKILFWTCYIYVRTQRNRNRVIIVSNQPQVRTQVITQATQAYNDSSSIINYAEPMSITTPPPYDQIAKDRSAPPAYDQIVSVPCAAGGSVANSVNATCPQASSATFDPINNDPYGYIHQFKPNRNNPSAPV